MLWQLSAVKAADQIREGRITSLELVEACLSRIDETDSDIGAWAYLDRCGALDQAAEMDDLRRGGRPTGPLHGVPVGIKDIFDTADMPTAWGTRCHADRQPTQDATVIDKLREAGAVILGKTVSTPLAFASPSATRNPHNPAHTPGGSSAGSAAGVAAGHVPLAVGSQTNGSVVRPASFCGVFGYKPTRGLISRRGCLQTSETLDQVGVFGRNLKDVAVLADALTGYDPADPLTHTRPKPQLLKACCAEVPAEPNFVWIDLPFYDGIAESTRHGVEELMDLLGERVERIAAPDSFTDALRHHRVVHEFEFLRNLENDPAIASDQTDDVLKAILGRARTVTPEAYARSLSVIAQAENFFRSFFNDYDAVIAPAALGEAPMLGDGTGDPVCSTIWTFAGLPCLSLPCLTGENDLPVGVQLIAAAEEDDRMFRTAAWLERRLASPDETPPISDNTIEGTD